MSENAQTDSNRRQHTSGIERKQAELAKRYAATRRPEQKANPEVSDNAQSDTTRRQYRTSLERSQAAAIERYKAARSTGQKSRRRQDDAAATRRAADSDSRNRGRSL